MCYRGGHDNNFAKCMVKNIARLVGEKFTNIIRDLNAEKDTLMLNFKELYGGLKVQGAIWGIGGVQDPETERA